MAMIHQFRRIYIVVFLRFVAVNEYVFYIYPFLYRHARMLRQCYEVSKKKMELYPTDWFQEEMSQLALAPDAPRLYLSLFTISIRSISTHGVVATFPKLHSSQWCNRRFSRGVF